VWFVAEGVTGNRMPTVPHRLWRKPPYSLAGTPRFAPTLARMPFVGIVAAIDGRPLQPVCADDHSRTSVAVSGDGERIVSGSVRLQANSGLPLLLGHDGGRVGAVEPG
jgi:hypothetical protein